MAASRFCARRQCSRHVLLQCRRAQRVGSSPTHGAVWRVQRRAYGASGRGDEPTAVAASPSLAPTRAPVRTAEDLFVCRFGHSAAMHRRLAAGGMSADEAVTQLFAGRGHARSRRAPWAVLAQLHTPRPVWRAVQRGGHAGDAHGAAVTAAEQPAPPPPSSTATERPSANAGGTSAATRASPTTPPHSSASVSSPPPSPAMQRYWHSWRLWNSLRLSMDTEQQAVLYLRAQVAAATSAREAALQQQLQKTTYYTVFIVLPLLSVLTLWLMLDAAVYAVELAAQPCVEYDEALRIYTAAAAEQQHRLHQRGKRSALTSKKKKNIPID